MKNRNNKLFSILKAYICPFFNLHMARRRRSKYGLRSDLGEIVSRNFLSYAMNPSGASYEKGLRDFVSTPERVEKYRRKVTSYFNALTVYLSEHPYAIKRAVEPVYSEVKKLASERIPAAPKPTVEVMA